MKRIIKTTLGDVNHGRCATRNNSRYTGRSTVWAVEIGADNWYASDRLRLAKEMAEFAETWDGKGDFELAFLSRNSSTAGVLQYCTSGAKMFPCFTPECI